MVNGLIGRTGPRAQACLAPKSASLATSPLAIAQLALVPPSPSPHPVLPAPPSHRPGWESGVLGSATSLLGDLEQRHEPLCALSNLHFALLWGSTSATCMEGRVAKDQG